MAPAASPAAVLGLTLLAFSPVLLLAVQAYGNEGILRVYLFSLPWAAALATYALIPRSRLSPGQAGAHRTRRAQRGPAGDGPWWSVRVLAALFIVLSLFLPAFFGDDAYNVMSVTEVTSVTSFLQQAPPGTIYAGIENAPFQDTWNYNEFLITPIFGRLAWSGLARSRRTWRRPSPITCCATPHAGSRYTSSSRPA